MDDKEFDYDLFEIEYGVNLRGDDIDLDELLKEVNDIIGEPDETMPSAADEMPIPTPAPYEEPPRRQTSARPAPKKPAARAPKHEASPAKRREVKQAARRPVRPVNPRIDAAERFADTEQAIERKPDDGAPIKQQAAKKSGSIMNLFDWLQCIVSAVLVGILVFVFVGRVIGVEGKSMLDTLQNTDRIVMSNLLYQPRYGDIVVLKTETYGDTPLVKRVIAVAGETIDIDFDTGDVMIDGQVIIENYIKSATLTREDFEGPVTVPEGFVFVMGDNRNESTDSRDDRVGLVDTREILGKVLFVIIPGPDADGHRDWSRLGSVYREPEA